MQKWINYKEVEVVYHDRGNGDCIVFLHGYLETAEIWTGFADRFFGGFRVLTLDLPGHGQSGTWGKVHSMDDLAGSVHAILTAENIDKVFLVGHSMGGYVTMAFAELFPQKLSGYALFHSTCFADSDEKKGNRDREISLVLCKKKRQIINVNIPKGFSDGNVDVMKSEVDRARNLAMNNPDKGIVAILNGMKERPDRTHVLKDPSIPLLIIGGMKDNYIPADVFEKLVALAPHATVLRLVESGHMGFLEEPVVSAEAIVNMMESLN
jgi:pimeloyl-ACP methyl ester carboxylesterase